MVDFNFSLFHLKSDDDPHEFINVHCKVCEKYTFSLKLISGKRNDNEFLKIFFSPSCKRKRNIVEQSRKSFQKFKEYLTVVIVLL